MLVARKDIAKFCEILRQGGQKVVFTNGCFDILHAGHVTYLEAAKAQGDVLVLGLNTDESVRRLKGPERPINSELDRAKVVAVIAEVKPDVYVKGGDYTLDTLPEAKIVQSYGGKVAFIDMVEGRSTTNIINKIKK